MSEKYRLMIYFAIATMHLYRASIQDDDDDLNTFKRRNQAVLLRVMQEARGVFAYELSAEQMDRAIISFRFPAQLVEHTKAFVMPTETAQP